MATYERIIEETSPGSGSYNVKLKLKEQYIYGGDRIGQRSTAVEEKVISLGTLSTSTVAHFRDNTNETKINWASYTLTLPSYADAHEASYNADIGVTPHKVYTAKRKLGEKSYELSNHLGNVMEVISDRRKSVDANTYTSTGTLSSATPDAKVDYYYADVLSYNDYYPFGMMMPNRNGSADAYSRGFNGMEKDEEVKGSGNSYNTEFRQLDPRLGRWLSLDPKSDEQQWQSPYVVHNNNPICLIDPKGDIAFAPPYPNTVKAEEITQEKRQQKLNAGYTFSDLNYQQYSSGTSISDEKDVIIGIPKSNGFTYYKTYYDPNAKNPAGSDYGVYTFQSGKDVNMEFSTSGNFFDSYDPIGYGITLEQQVDQQLQQIGGTDRTANDVLNSGTTNVTITIYLNPLDYNDNHMDRVKRDIKNRYKYSDISVQFKSDTNIKTATNGDDYEMKMDVELQTTVF